MAGFYSGNFTQAKVIHPLDVKNEPDVGPSAYTLLVGAAIQSTTALFGSALETATGTRDRMLSNAAVVGADISDTGKVLVHFFWRTDSLAVENNFVELTDPGETAHKLRFFRASPTGFFMRWHRELDFSPLNETIQIVGAEDTVVINTFHCIVGFLDANSVTQGKVFVDAVDKTGVVSAINLTGNVSSTGFDSILFGNHEAAFNLPARFLDHFTMIQDSSLTNTTVTALVAQYGGIGTDAVRGFGFRPKFSFLSKTDDVQSGNILTLTGSGFGKDVTIKAGGITMNSITRTNDGSLTFVIPNNIPFGTHDLEIINTVAGVTFTEQGAFTVSTLWIPNGISDDTAKSGDGHTSGELVCGDPVDVFNPNIEISTWTKTSPAPEA